MKYICYQINRVNAKQKSFYLCLYFFFAFCTEWKAFGSGLLKSYFHLYSYWLAFVLPSLVYRFALVTSLGIANLFYPFSLKIEHHVRSILAPGDYFFSLSIFLLLLLSFFKWFFILCMCVSGFCDAILNIECDSGSFKKLKWFWSFIFFFSVLTIDQLFDILKRRERCERKPNERIRKKRKNLILWSRLENNDRIKRTMNVFFYIVYGREIESSCQTNIMAYGFGFKRSIFFCTIFFPSYLK